MWTTQGLTAPLDYMDGATPSAEQVDETPDSPLANGVYRIYARGRRYFDAAQFGAWAYIAITLNVEPCPAPVLSATLDDVNQRIVLQATPQAALGAASPLTTIERSEDGAATWEPVRGASRAAGTFGVAMTIYDYEAARATAVQYRACTEASFADVQLVSDYSAAAVAGTLSRAAWNLKCPLDPPLNVLDVLIDKDPDWTQNEDAATFRPVGRKFPVVVSMSVGGADGSLSITCYSDAEWAAVEELRDYAGALLLESPYGWSRYIRVLQRSWTETGAPGAARRHVAFSFLEVGTP